MLKDMPVSPHPLFEGRIIGCVLANWCLMKNSEVAKSDEENISWLAKAARHGRPSLEIRGYVVWTISDNFEFQHD